MSAHLWRSELLGEPRRLEVSGGSIDDAYSFTPEDRPDAVADAIASFSPGR